MPHFRRRKVVPKRFRRTAYSDPRPNYGNYLHRYIKPLRNLITNSIGYKDFQSASISADTTTYPIFQFTGVPVQGDTPLNRDSDNIAIKAIHYTMRILGTESALITSDYFNTVRVIIFVYKHPVGTANLTSVPAITGTKGLLDNSVITRYIDAPYSFDAKSNFRVLSDKRYTVSGISSSVDPGAFNTDHVIEFRKTIRFKKPLKQMFNAGAGATTDYNTNIVMIAIMSDSSATAFPSVQYSTRMEISR